MIRLFKRLVVKVHRVGVLATIEDEGSRLLGIGAYSPAERGR